MTFKFYDKYGCVYTRPPGYFDPLVSEIVKFFKSNRSIRILDIGCGFGDFLASFQKELGDKAQYYGLTVTPHEFDHIKKKHPFIDVRLRRQQDLLKVFKTKFDIIINFHTLSYVIQKKQIDVVRQMLPCLNKGGILVLGLIDSFIKISSETEKVGEGFIQFYYSPWLFLPLDQNCSLVQSFREKKNNYRIHLWKKVENKRKGIKGLFLAGAYIIRNNLLFIDVLFKIYRKVERKIKSKNNNQKIKP